MNRAQRLLDRMAHPGETDRQRAQRRFRDELPAGPPRMAFPTVQSNRPDPAVIEESIRQALQQTLGVQANVRAIEVRGRGAPFPEPQLADDEWQIVRIYRQLARQAAVSDPRDFIFAAVPLSHEVGQLLDDADRQAICRAAAEGAHERLEAILRDASETEVPH